MKSPAALKLSLIIPVYNRPEEIKELLESLLRQTYKDFEVIIVEDGSTIPSKEIAEKFSEQLNIKYYYKPNSGPGPTRNYGMEKASGNYFIILDSDVILPPRYVENVIKALNTNYVDAFGGPDKEHESFSDIQKAISYAMTSPLTTGGIRGKSEKFEKFHPRSFNMGISKKVFQKTGGFFFSRFQYGEDIDLSIRIIQAGFKTRLIPEAYVYHKRRTDFKSFFRQARHSGEARIELMKKHKGSLKLVHSLPALFTVTFFISVFISLLMKNIIFIVPYFIYFFLVFLHALVYFKKVSALKRIKIAFLSVVASFVMLAGYGTGFLINAGKYLIERLTQKT